MGVQLPSDNSGSLNSSKLSAQQLSKSYRNRLVVDNMNISVDQGEIVGLLGPNGAGKTTTFYMIVGLITPDTGKVFLDEDDLTQTPMYRRARMGVGYLAQEPSIFRKLTVEQNIRAILETMGLPKDVAEERIESLLEELSLEPLRVRHTLYPVANAGGWRLLEPSFSSLSSCFSMNLLQELIR